MAWINPKQTDDSMLASLQTFSTRRPWALGSLVNVRGWTIDAGASCLVFSRLAEPATRHSMKNLQRATPASEAQVENCALRQCRFYGADEADDCLTATAGAQDSRRLGFLRQNCRLEVIISGRF